MEAVMQVGYARVSTQDQDLTIQRERLAWCEKLFEETASGTDAQRPQLQACLNYVREGDTLVITRLDRLERVLKIMPGSVPTAAASAESSQASAGFHWSGACARNPCSSGAAAPASPASVRRSSTTA